MNTRDVFRNINELDNDTLKRIIERLEFRGKDPVFRGWLDNYLDKMTLHPKSHILILGCGTGMEARVLAARPEFNGHITAVDISLNLILVARKLSMQEGLSEIIDFQTGDANQLIFNDSQFDAVIAHTLISHVDQPIVVLKEAARVLKPTGMLAIFDGDYASWTFGFSDEVFAKTMDEAIVHTIVNNPRVMRGMPRLLMQAGLSMEKVIPHIFAEVGSGSFFLSAAETYGPLPVKAKLLPENKVNEWLDAQRQYHENGIFFAAGNYYTYLARKKPGI